MLVLNTGEGPRGVESLARKASLSERTVSTARDVLSGQHRGTGAYLAFAGPAIVASIAYIDPGNFATNIQAGAKYGYVLLWVVNGARWSSLRTGRIDPRSRLAAAARSP
jgi:hypothetical protein